MQLLVVTVNCGVIVEGKHGDRGLEEKGINRLSLVKHGGS